MTAAPNMICSECNAQGECDFTSSENYRCIRGYVDSDGDANNGCDRKCSDVTNGHCVACATSGICSQVECDPGYGDVNNDGQTCSSCAAIYDNYTAINMVCSACNHQNCTAQICSANWANNDDSLVNGCEQRCPTPENAVCQACQDMYTCDRLVCNANFFNTNGHHRDGCEETCSAVSGGTCDSCSAPDHCTSVTCSSNFFDKDSNPANGCETGCSQTGIVHGTCIACSSNGNTCDTLECNAGYADSNSNKQDGCETACISPDPANSICLECLSNQECLAGNEHLLCLPNFANADQQFTTGCERPCEPPQNGVCITCEAPVAPATHGVCTQSVCDSGFSNLNGDPATCESCAAFHVANGLCSACNNQGCTAVVCSAGYHDGNGNIGDGCERHCPAVANAVCDECSADELHCLALTCNANWFNDDGVLRNGCEATCPAIPDGVCRECSSSAICTQAECDANRFTLDGDANNGCEAGCPGVADGTCVACGGYDEKTMLHGSLQGDPNLCTEVQCAAGRFYNTDGNHANGCEQACLDVPQGICNTCGNDAEDCADLTCSPGFYTALPGHDHEHGCEIQCNTVLNGKCRKCDVHGVCDSAMGLSCDEGWTDFDEDASNGCENRCANVDHGHCVTCLQDVDGDSAEASASGQCTVAVCEVGYGQRIPGSCMSCDIYETLQTGGAFPNAQCTDCDADQCTALSCSVGFVNLDGEISNGCEVACTSETLENGSCASCMIDPARPNGTTTVCNAISCAPNYFNLNGVIRDGCESSCPGVQGGTCISCSDQTTCTEVTCVAGHFNADGDARNGCEVSCASALPDIPHGTCTACAQQAIAEPSGALVHVYTCTDIECSPGWNNVDNRTENGCEVNCISPANSICLECAEDGACLANVNGGGIQCLPGYTNPDGLSVTGCERECSSDTVANGTCIACDTNGECTASACDPGFGRRNETHAPVLCTSCADLDSTVANAHCTACNNDRCTELRCLPNFQDADGDVANGCERECLESPPNSACTACSPSGYDCLALSCHDSHFDLNGNIRDGCEQACTHVTGGSGGCTSCSSPEVCTAVACLPGLYDSDGNPANGCEGTCDDAAPRTGATCMSCAAAGGAQVTCNAFSCLPGHMDHNSQASDGCETQCESKTNGICTRCRDTGSCQYPGEDETWQDSMMCHVGFWNADNLLVNGCEEECAQTVANGTCIECSESSFSEDYGACTVAACDAGFGANLNGNDPLHCASCSAFYVAHGTCTSCDAHGCLGLTCQPGYWNFNGDVWDGCELACPSAPHAVCNQCSDELTCTDLTCHGNFLNNNHITRDGCEACPPNYFDIDGQSSAGGVGLPTHGCEETCHLLYGGVCTACTSPRLGDCQEIECHPNHFNDNGNVTDGCEAGCPVVPNADCTGCSSSSNCTEHHLTCATNWHDVDGDANTGCEETCHPVPNGNCTACPGGPEPEHCTAVYCNMNFFNLDGNFANGCEVGCAELPQATCTLCSHPDGGGLAGRDSYTVAATTVVSGTVIQTGQNYTNGSVSHSDQDSSVPHQQINANVTTPNPFITLYHGGPAPEDCLQLVCHDNFFNGDNITANGCERPCKVVPNAVCLVCGERYSCEELNCTANFFDDNNSTHDGCENTCPQVPGGDCVSCSNSTSCDEVVCRANFFDVNHNANDGCESDCPEFPHGNCTVCANHLTCTNITCAANWFNLNRNANDGCEETCPAAANANCTGCSSPATCDESLICHANWFNVNADPTDGCEKGCGLVPAAQCMTCPSGPEPMHCTVRHSGCD